ncbi:MAG TPA: glycosyltransferase family 4 protein [Acidobacteriota bacterium]|jgi:glycosyltransferase involved in cell wall biosynthesis|nr:glycosyltransferase family 4 protein [Acidobacteriota bacterium]
MRLLAIYSTEDLLGGGEISFTLTLQLVQQSGWNILAIIPGEGPLARFLEQRGISYQVAPIEPLRQLRNLRYLIRPKPDWMKVALRYRPHLIHCNSVRAALYGQALGHNLRVPTVFTARKTESDGLIDYFLMRRLDAVVCVSQAVKQRFPDFLGSEKLNVIYNAVDPKRFSEPRTAAQQLRNRWLAGAEGPLVGVVGRLSPIKGQHLVVEAAPRILAELPAVRFVFVGSEDSSYPGHESKLRDRVRELALQDRVLFCGFRSDIECIYQALDLVLFPSRSEGFGRIIIEAGAARRAVVAGDIEVIREILPPSLHDLLVPLDNVDVLADRTVKLLRDDALRSEKALQLYDHVCSRYAPEIHRREILELYRKLTSSQKHSAAKPATKAEGDHVRDREDP